MTTQDLAALLTDAYEQVPLDDGPTFVPALAAYLHAHRVPLAATPPAIDPEEPVIGPIQHSNPMCKKDACSCWCQACERHNWRHERATPPAIDPLDTRAYEADGVLVVPWRVSYVIELQTPEEIAALPDGTVLRSIAGETVVKGTDPIDLDTRFGRTAYGVQDRRDLFRWRATTPPAIDPEELARALHRYWHTDEAWQSIPREQDMANHRRNAEGIIAALEVEDAAPST